MLHSFLKRKTNSQDLRAFDPPLRSELFTAEQLDRHARFLASTHRVTTSPGSDVLLDGLDRNEVTLRAFQRDARAADPSVRVTPAVEWMLDNFYLIEEHIQIARRHLPPGYSRRLPWLTSGASEGFPRVYGLILELISHLDAQVDAGLLTSFIASYQTVAPLQLGELWAVPIMLRLALIEDLKRVAVHLEVANDDREQANYWIDRMQKMSKTNPAHVVVVVAEMAKADIPLSHAFVAEFCQRISWQDPTLQIAQEWFTHRLATEEHSIEQLVGQETQMQASNQVTVSNVIASLRLLKVINWEDFVENLSIVDHTLRAGPTDVYSTMDFVTRDKYRQAVEEMARFSAESEVTVARKAVELAAEGAKQNGGDDRSAHVGFYLIAEGKSQFEDAFSPRWPWRTLVENWIRRSPLIFYLGGIGLITLLSMLVTIAAASRFGVGGWRLWALIVPFTLASSQMAKALMDWLSGILVRPRLLPRLDYTGGIPADSKTIVVVPTMLTDIEGIDRLIESLEIHFLANRDENLHFALLTDFRDASSETLPEDAMLVERVSAGISTLQQRYAAYGTSIFYLFHRPRRWNPSEDVWMGHERKRGKLSEFNGYLRGQSRDAFSVILGDTEILPRIKYVITLDTDTQLPRAASHSLVGALAHPLNKAQIDPLRGIVTKGYGILQPRVSVSLPTAERSFYVRLFAGDSGIDPYTRAVSNTYQDLFGEGSFIGKGIYEVDAFEGVLHGRFPDNKILSHDLIEACYARSGLISDVELFEEFPYRYNTDLDRRRRWIRGDWQIMQWVMPRVPGGDGKLVTSTLSPLSRWKILDNLRRSTVSTALVLFLLGGWILLPKLGSLVVLIVAVLLLFPEMTSTVGDLSRRSKDISRSLHLRFVINTFFRKLAQTLFSLALLPYDAFMSLGAIVRSVTRVFITHKRLLEWRTSGEMERIACKGLGSFYRTMWISPVIGVSLALFLAATHSIGFLAALPILILWVMAPWIAWFTSQPLSPPSADLSAEQMDFLQITARKTWWFFERFATAEENWLPPDNFQEEVIDAVAPRTSPTNIGLSLLANLAAYDFGYISAGRLIRRTSDTVATMQLLEKHRGHFYNWYDTRTLQPLPPRYVSVVDSGNLAGMLLTLASGLRELTTGAALNQRLVAGLRDTVAILCDDADDESILRQMKEALLKPQNTFKGSYALVNQLLALGTALVDRVTQADQDELRTWSENLCRQCEDYLEELLHLAPWLADPDPNSGAPVGFENAMSLPALSLLTAPAAEFARERIELLEALALECDELARMEWEFLFDSRRKLFAVGYNLTDQRLDSSCYDLLASEARLASYVAIAQGDVGEEHWFSLGRLLVAAYGETILVSWSGSMFEYLMPNLIMPNYANTLIGRTCIAAVEQQITYGKAHRVPWGISESGYNRTDAHFNYQYRAFGVPSIGLKRGLEDDLVIAPYASALALMIAPRRACANLQLLAREGRVGSFGFYEAIDYTPSRMPPKQTSVTVRSFMSHHQGMILLSLLHFLRDSPMQRRFGGSAMLRTADLLLQERVPRAEATLFVPELNLKDDRDRPADDGQGVRLFSEPNTPAPEVHLLSNRRYHVAISNAGGGFSKWKDLAVTRWREDATRDCWGYFVYLRDVNSGKLWSAAYQPSLQRTKQYEAIFAQGRAEFRQRHLGFSTHTEIGVSPEDDVELRRITITNRSQETRTIEVTSYAEVVMATQAADASHRAFSNLFVLTEFNEATSAILCTRRPRSEEEKPPFMLHLLVGQGGEQGVISYETDRARFIGRNGSLIRPGALHSDSPLSNTTGAVLDPIVSLQRRVTLAPGEEATLVFVLGMGDTREAAEELVQKYRDLRMTDRAFELAWTHSQVALHQLNATEAEAQLYSRLASSLIYANPSYRADINTLRHNRRGQSSLWAYGISGDIPIVLLRIDNFEGFEVVEQLIKAHSHWRMKGLAVELVIVNEDVSVYRQSLHDAIIGSIMLGIGAPMIDRPEGIFVRRHEQIADENLILLQSVARIVLYADRGSLAALMKSNSISIPVRETDGSFRVNPVHTNSTVLPQRDLIFDNGLGGFTLDGQEYVITLQPGQVTPAPWVNVIANPFFGTMISETGGAYTWLENARQFPITPWNNDPVVDPSGEAFYIRDDETGEFWSPTPMPARGATPYVIRHGFGYSVFEHTENGISSELWVYVAIDAPVKFAVLKLTNVSDRSRQISVTAYFEWVLSELRENGLMHAQTEIDQKTGALLARNSYSAEFPNRVAFVDVNRMNSVSGDRREFIGRNGTLAYPAGMRRKALSGKVGAGLDPCGAVMVSTRLHEGETQDFVFRLGVGRSPGDVQELIQRFRGAGACRAALEEVWGYWNRTLGVINIETPNTAANMIANGWLLYQTIGCRMWGRTSFYQSGGAYGFRDQLQDSMALVHAEPSLMRKHLLRAAERQFQQGDVQHWWHPPQGRGVRTHFSDDFLWLPLAVIRYVTCTADTGVLDETISFLEGRPVRDDEEAYYDLPMRSVESATLYEHCVRAIENGMHDGIHGVPLIGCGDWNDGMNRIGKDGRGESVWLAFFQFTVLNQFADLASRRNDNVFADRCRARAAVLQRDIEKNTWDGSWYRRAYFDNGDPVGSHLNDECQIDSLPQSWAIISGAGSPERARTAMEAVDRRLVHRDTNLIQLFDPPFDRSPVDPGYIKGYIPGIRENGGQYTHAAIWAVMAFALMGDHDRAWELFDLLNPVNHGATKERIDIYKVEPYVAAADVYGCPPHTGRGGWTWYTGAAGWMYRLLVETLLGLHLEGSHLRLEPRLPTTWNSLTIHYRYRQTTYHITYAQERGSGPRAAKLTLDGVVLPDQRIPLVDEDRTCHAHLDLAYDDPQV